MKGSAGLTFSALKQIYNAVFANKGLETSFKTNIPEKYCIVYILLDWPFFTLLKFSKYIYNFSYMLRRFSGVFLSSDI